MRRWSKKRGWALDLRLSLLILFGLVWVAQRSGTSVLIAGFGVGLMVAAIGGPRRFTRQVAGVAQGFMVPLFFVVLGARLDLRALGQHPSLIVLAALLVLINLTVHALAALLTRQPLAAGLAATAQLGVPAAVVALGLELHIITIGVGSAIRRSCARITRASRGRRNPTQAQRSGRGHSPKRATPNHAHEPPARVTAVRRFGLTVRQSRGSGAHMPPSTNTGLAHPPGDRGGTAERIVSAPVHAPVADSRCRERAT